MANLVLWANVLAIVALVVWYINRCYSHWSSRGVPGPRPVWFLGNLLDRILKQPDEYELDYFKRYGRVYGIYSAFTPKLTISEPELIKQVLIKDFANFVNRRVFNAYHHIWSHNLFLIDNVERWKKIRSMVSPAFTTGKLKGMHTIMARSVQKLERYFENMMKHQQLPMAMQTRTVLQGFTIDVIASTAFGTETDANNPDGRDAKLLENANAFFDISTLKGFIILGMPPWVNKLLGISLAFSKSKFNYIYSLIKQILRARLSSNVKRNDFVQILLEARNKKVDSFEKLMATMDEPDVPEIENDDDQENGDHLTEAEIIAQCMVFFVAGYETSTTTLMNIVYELALNQDIQDRLAMEISEVLGWESSPDSGDYYDKIMSGLPYLDAVVKEALRKYPPVSRLSRVASQSTKVGGIEILADQEIEISVCAVHMDPANYPDPQRFEPQRFMPENKASLVPYAYLPFGHGPRNCVGMRFAYQQVKVCVAHLLPRFRFTANQHTPAKLSYSLGPSLMTPIEVAVSVSRR